MYLKPEDAILDNSRIHPILNMTDISSDLKTNSSQFSIDNQTNSQTLLNHTNFYDQMHFKYSSDLHIRREIREREQLVQSLSTDINNVNNSNQTTYQNNFNQTMIDKLALEIKLLNSLLNINQIIKSNSQYYNNSIISSKENIISYFENDKIEVDESTLQEQIEQASHLLQFYENQIENLNFNSNSILKSPRRPNRTASGLSIIKPKLSIVRPNSNLTKRSPRTVEVTISPNDTYENIGNYDLNGNFFVKKHKINYITQMVNGRKIKCRAADFEVFSAQDANGTVQQFERPIEYELIALKDDTTQSIQKVLIPKPEYDYQTIDGQTYKVQKKFNYTKIEKGKYKRTQVSNPNDLLTAELVTNLSVEWNPRHHSTRNSPSSIDQSNNSPSEIGQTNISPFSVDNFGDSTLLNNSPCEIDHKIDLLNVDGNKKIVLPSTKKKSPRHIPKTPNDIDVKNQTSTKVLTEPTESTQNATQYASQPTARGSASPTPHTTGKIVNSKINNLLGDGNDGSDSEPTVVHLKDYQGTPSIKKDKKIQREPNKLYNFILDYSHIIIDNMEKAAGIPNTRPKTRNQAPQQFEEVTGLTDREIALLIDNYEKNGELPDGYTVIVDENGQKKLMKTKTTDPTANPEQALAKLKRFITKVSKKHRRPPEFEYEEAEDEDFSPIIRKFVVLYKKVRTVTNGVKSTELVKLPHEGFNYLEVDTIDENDNLTTKLVKQPITYELDDIESEGGTVRPVYCIVPPEIEYEWVQREDDPTIIEKVPRQWGYKWTYGEKGKRIKVIYDQRAFVPEETRDWKGNPMTVMKRIKMEEIEVECDDGVVRKIRRPVTKIEYQLYEEENEDGTFSIVNRPVTFVLLENNKWKQIESPTDFFYEEFENDGKVVIEKRRKEYELVDVECDDGVTRKVYREKQTIEYDEVVDEKTGKKKLVPRTVLYAYKITEDENGNKIKVRTQIMSENEMYEFIGNYDEDGNFTVVKQKVRYGYKYDFNGKRIRYRIADTEVIEDENGDQTTKEVQYETVEVVLPDGTIQKVLKRKEDYEYIMVVDELTGETKYLKQKVQYTTTTTVDENGNIVTIRKKVVTDFDEIADGVDENGNVIYRKVPREYEIITMKNSKGEIITIKRAKKYNYEEVVDENGVVHLVRKEKIKPKRVRKRVKRLISFPKPIPRSKSFSFLRRYPHHPQGIKKNGSIANFREVIQMIQNDSFSDDGFDGVFVSKKDFYRQLIKDAFAYRIRKAQLNLEITEARIQQETIGFEQEKVQDDIDFVIFEIRSKLPKLTLITDQYTYKPPSNGPEVGVQTDLTNAQLAEFHMKVRSGIITNHQLDVSKENHQTLTDYVDKLQRDLKKKEKEAENHLNEGNEILKEIRIYKPNDDDIPMPPETRKRMQLQESFKQTTIKLNDLKARLKKVTEKLEKLREIEKDQRCITEMTSDKVDGKKTKPKIAMTRLKYLRELTQDEYQRAACTLKLNEIEENILDDKLNYLTNVYSDDNICKIANNLTEMENMISNYKRQFREKRKIKDDDPRLNFVVTNKLEMAEFENRNKQVSKQVRLSTKKEPELIATINAMTLLMKEYELRIPQDNLVTVYE